MKNNIIITFTLLALLIGTAANAQITFRQKAGAFSATIKKAAVNHDLNISKFKRSLRRTENAPSRFHLFSHQMIRPEVSVDLLDGKGIHLFTISNIPQIPTINVGARIHTGIVITL